MSNFKAYWQRSSDHQAQVTLARLAEEEQRKKEEQDRLDRIAAERQAQLDSLAAQRNQMLEAQRVLLDETLVQAQAQEASQRAAADALIAEANTNALASRQEAERIAIESTANVEKMGRQSRAVASSLRMLADGPRSPGPAAQQSTRNSRRRGSKTTSTGLANGLTGQHFWLQSCDLTDALPDRSDPLRTAAQ